MKLDTNRAWESGFGFVRKNIGLLAVIGGLFFFLPSAILGVVYPEPETGGDMEPAEMLAAMEGYFAEVWPYMIASAIITSVGTLAVYRLASVRDGRTVGEVLKDGVRFLLPYLGASLLIGLGFAFFGALAVLLVALIQQLIGDAAGVVLGFVLLIAVMPLALWLSMRLILLGPAMVAEEIRSPIAAIKRSLALTKGNSLRIFVFILLLIVSAVILLSILQLVVGLVIRALVGGESAVALITIAGSALSAVLTVVFIAVIAAIYRQLATPPASAAGVPKSGE